MDKAWTPTLKDMPAEEPIIIVWDVRDGAFIDLTPAAARFMAAHDITSIPRTISIKQHFENAQWAIETGNSHTSIEWLKYDSAWHKVARTVSHAGGSRVLEIVLDITHLDPRAEWLARINLDSQRLELDNGESFSFDEFAVLHLLLKGYKYKQIAAQLNISPKTVDYRLAKLKEALEVDSTGELMLKLTSSGLIHLVMVPTDPDNPAKTEEELYRRIEG